MPAASAVRRSPRAGILREERAEVHVPDLFVVGGERLPRRACRQRWMGSGHVLSLL